MDLRDLKEFIKDSLGYIIVGFIVFLVAVYIISFQQVSGPSMKPTYNSRDILLLNKTHYIFFEPKRFDVVAAESGSAVLVKRVIGLPGEKIEYKNNILYVNGDPVEESFNIEGETKDFSTDVIPEGKYFLIGDNRSKSIDSRNEEIGLISKKDLIGKVMFRIWKG